jgi:BexC/CtrB/KpsE family polysaccharide export inner-membrane protein
MLANLSKKIKTPNWLFAVTVVIPVACSIIYYGFLASDVYVSESRFVVRSPDKPASSGLGVILKSAGFANASDEVFAVQSFVTSRDALRAINRNEAFRNAYTRPGISIIDRFDPTGLYGSFEHLFNYYGGKVSLKSDAATSITTLTVKSYDAQSARKFNEQLLEMSEAMVNRLNERGREDLIGYASAEVQRAQSEAQRAASAMAAYRNRSGVVDPEKQAQIQLQMVSKLQDELIAARSLLAQLREAAPQNPQIPSVQSQIATLQREIAVEQAKAAGGSRSLSVNAVRFQQLELENEFAGKQLAGALASLEEARNEARRKQAYVERIVNPSLPDEAIEPRRLRGIFATLIIGLIAYGILRMLLAGVREHAQ